MILKLIASWWLLAMIFAPVIALVVWQVWHHRKNNLKYAWLRRGAIVSLLLIMALRPSFVGGSAPQGMTNFDVFFVVDTTDSMMAEDYNGSHPRLDGVKQDIKDISTAMTGSRFTLMTFNSETYTDLPLTTDTSAVQAMAATLQGEVTYYASGSSISQPVDTLSDELDRIHKAQPERQAIVYIFTDGEQTSDEKVGSFAGLRQKVSAGAVLGYGTSAGGKMKEYSGYDQSSFSSSLPEQYIKDYSSSAFPTPDAISKIDEGNLKKMAEQMGVPYVHRISAGDIDGVVRQGGITKLGEQHRDLSAYWDAYWLIASVVIVLLGWESWRMRDMLQDIPKRKGQA